MKWCAFLSLSLVLICAPECDSFKILKKIKDYLHPTTTTSTALPPTLPEYKGDNEHSTESNYASKTTCEEGEKSTTETGSYPDSINQPYDMNLKPTTPSSLLTGTYEKKQATNPFNSDEDKAYPGMPNSISPAIPESSYHQSTQQPYHDELLSTSLTNTNGYQVLPNQPTGAFTSNKEYNYPGILKPTLPTNLDGSHQQPSQDFSNNGFTISSASTSTASPDSGGYHSQIQPNQPNKQDKSEDENNYPGMTKPSKTTNTDSSHNQPSQGSFYNDLVSSTTTVSPSSDGYQTQIQHSQSNSKDTDSAFSQQTGPVNPDTSYNQIDQSSGNQKNTTTLSTFPSNSDTNQNKPSPHKSTTSSATDHDRQNEKKPTTQHQQNKDKEQQTQETSSEDGPIIYPDHPSLNPTPEPERAFEKGYGGHHVSTSTSRSPREHVPVDSDGGRRIIDGPTKECGEGKKLDGNGNCKKIARK